MARARIEHFVVLMLENRSFDHLFGFRTGVNGLKGNEFNLLDPGNPESDSNPAFVVNNGAPFAVPVGNGPEVTLTATAKVWVPALPPIPATIGMRTARTANFAISASNKWTTEAASRYAKMLVTRLPPAKSGS